MPPVQNRQLCKSQDRSVYTRPTRSNGVKKLDEKSLASVIFPTRSVEQERLSADHRLDRVHILVKIVQISSRLEVSKLSNQHERSPCYRRRR